MKTGDFDYRLPPEFIAQTAVEPRDHSRLMVLSRGDGSMEHRYFYELVEYLEPGDLLVCNNSRVIPARLYGRKADGGDRVELLLLRRLEPGVWEALTRPGRRLKAGAKIDIGTGPQESACKNVIGRRLKGCGMRWAPANAEAMARLRAMMYSTGRWDAFWQARQPHRGAA